VSTGPAGTADEEFREFMLVRWPAIVRLAYGLTGDLGHAEVVALAAFARAYASWGKVTSAGGPDAYLWRLVVSVNQRRFRGQRAAGGLPGTPPDRGAADTADAPDRRALLGELGQLRPRQRAVIVLRFWMNLSEAETAQVLGCAVSAVRSHASRALAILRAYVAVPDIGLTGAGYPESGLPGTRFSGAGFTDADVIEGGLR
jgi:RNA polymerase sigma-70 factor (sigma-E family)